MKTIRKDDRTKEQKLTHRFLVTATDKFMSGWGLAKGGLSKIAWACDNENDMYEIFEWAKKRSEMKYVNVLFGGRWYPAAAHVHIYVVDKNHPGLTQKNNNQDNINC